MSIVYLGADHRGFNLKDRVKEWLREWNYTSVDVGNSKYNRDDDYVDFALNVAERVRFEKAIGILICGSGIGMSIAANKVSGARAALCTSEKQARMARTDDDANVLCLSAELVSENDNKTIVKTFLETLFSSEEKYIRRIKKIKIYEQT